MSNSSLKNKLESIIFFFESTDFLKISLQFFFQIFATKMS